MKESLKLFGVYQEMEFTETTNYCSFYDNKLNSFIACEVIWQKDSSLYWLWTRVAGIHSLKDKEPSYPTHWLDHLWFWSRMYSQGINSYFRIK